MKMAGASSSVFRLSAIVVAIVVLISTTEAQDHVSPPKVPVAAVSCNALIPLMTPCRQYLMGSEPNPPNACCLGAKNINDKSQTQQDRIATCNCIKQALSIMGKYDPNRISMIPKQCGFSFSLPAITKNTDCSKVVGGVF